MSVVESPEQAKKDQSYYKALTELLYQLADDDFINAFRGSEWLGLAPHIEEDVAFSSITQNTMGHAVLLYRLLEDLGEGEANSLAHDRAATKRRNAVYLEKKNGTGTYLEEPHYDWALTVVRQYLYEVLKKTKLEAATASSYQPLAHAAQKILMEQTYHEAHWKMWVTQLQDTTPEAKKRIQSRLDEAWKEMGDALDLGPEGEEMRKQELLPKDVDLKKRWLQRVEETLSYTPDASLQSESGNGRSGQHTEDLDQALQTLTEVYQTDTAAIW